MRYVHGKFSVIVFGIHWEDSPETDRMSEVSIIHQYVYAMVSALR